MASIASDRASRIETFARGTLDRVKFLAAQPYMESLISSGKPLPETGRCWSFLRGRNIYLFSAKGQLLYSKDTDDPPTKELLETVNRTRTLMSAEISDYRLDPRPIPALYVAAPIFESSGAISGVVAARLLNEDIDNVVNDYVGLGKTRNRNRSD